MASPGMFGLGPVHALSRLIYQEMEVAARSEDRDLIGAVLYFPMRIAREAAVLNATGLVSAMLALYPEFYRLATGP